MLDKSKATNNEITYFVKQDNLEEVASFGDELKQINYFIPDKPKFNIPTKNLSLIHIAAYYNALEVFIYLDKVVNLDIRKLSSESLDPLFYACATGSTEIVGYILQRDKELNPINPIYASDYSNHGSYLLIYLATYNDSVDILNLFFDYGYQAFLTSKNRLKFGNPIKMAIEHLNSRCLSILLKQFSDSNTDGFSTIMDALVQGYDEAIPILLKSKCSPVRFTPDGQTALSIACRLQKISIIKLLLDNIGFDIDIPLEINAPSAVHWLCMSASVEICDLFLSRNISVTRTDKDGRPGPYYLVDKASPQVSIDIIDRLISRGYSLSASWGDGETILKAFLASVGRKKYLPVVSYLISRGHPVDVPFSPGRTIRQMICDFAEKQREFAEVRDKFNLK